MGNSPESRRHNNSIELIKVSRLILYSIRSNYWVVASYRVIHTYTAELSRSPGSASLLGPLTKPGVQRRWPRAPAEFRCVGVSNVLNHDDTTIQLKNESVALNNPVELVCCSVASAGDYPLAYPRVKY